MSNQFASIANALGILKIFYAGPIVSQFNDEIPLFRAAEKGREKFNGLQVNRPIKVLRNPGIGATSDGGNLPAIGKQTTTQAIITARYNYLRFGVTGPMIKASQGDKGSFVGIMEYEMEQGLVDSKNDVNRQLFWNGRGDLATVSSAAVNSSVITVTGRTTGEDGSKYLFQTMEVDIYDPVTSVQKAASVTINTVTGTATAILALNQNVTVAVGDILVRAGAYNNEIQGIRTTLDGLSTTIYGINRATYPVYNGTVVNASGQQLRLDLMKQTINETRYKSGEKVSAIMTDFATERYYEKLLISDKRFIGEKVTGDGSFANKGEAYLAYGAIPVVADKDCPGNEMNFLTMAGWKKYVLGAEFEWADETGSYMIAQTGTDQFECRLRLFCNMFPEKPSGSARLTNYVSP